jgi:L-threonylcarbamoyladenylate synthase
MTPGLERHSMAWSLSARPTRIMPAGPDAIAEARAVLAEGGLVAFPTETVYGLGADATDDAAVARLYAAKERPSFNPLIVHAADLDAARGIAAFGDAALRLAGAFWPGPLTLVLRGLPSCPVGMLATAGLDTVAIRVPSHPVARDILRAFGRPVVAPSANRSGAVSPTTAEHVRADLDGRIDLIVDDGASKLGVESTIVGCFDSPALLRPGAVPRAAIEAVLGYGIAPPPVDTPPPRPLAREGREEAEARPRAPGMVGRHYAPRATVRMNAVAVAPGEALLAFGSELPPGADRATATLNLSERGLVVEAAANLFAHLRALDGRGVGAIAVMPIPEEGLGEAINDRLRHAAAPREMAARPHARR